MQAFKQALDRLAHWIKSTKRSRRHCAVHTPRIGWKMPSVSWYSVERTLQSCLATRGVPTTVYYFQRHGGGGGGGGGGGVGRGVGGGGGGAGAAGAGAGTGTGGGTGTGAGDAAGGAGAGTRVATAAKAPPRAKPTSALDSDAETEPEDEADHPVPTAKRARVGGDDEPAGGASGAVAAASPSSARPVVPESPLLAAWLEKGRAVAGLARECPDWEDNVRFMVSQPKADVQAALTQLQEDVANDVDVEGQEISLRFFEAVMKALVAQV